MDTPLPYIILTNQSASFFAGFDSITTCGIRYTAQQKRRQIALENITYLHHPPTTLSLICGQTTIIDSTIYNRGLNTPNELVRDAADEHRYRNLPDKRCNHYDVGIEWWRSTLSRLEPYTHWILRRDDNSRLSINGDAGYRRVYLLLSSNSPWSNGIIRYFPVQTPDATQSNHQSRSSSIGVLHFGSSVVCCLLLLSSSGDSLNDHFQLTTAVVAQCW